MKTVSNFSCPNPHCGGFSFFCNGDFGRPAARIWRESVIGFSPIANGQNSHSDHATAGIAIIRCRHEDCRTVFCFPLSWQALSIYMEQCPGWRNALASAAG
ncbi:MAG: hypothetical protein KGI49_01590 [Patescibacteria group bacterium]|nr:hypothetical protein [Patescibacteria group bacterium]